MISRVKTGNGLFFLDSFDSRKIVTDKQFITLIDDLKTKNPLKDNELVKYHKEMIKYGE